MLQREALLENMRVGFDALRIHPMRTLLSVLGILIGSGALVATMAVSDGLVAFARRTVERETPIQVVVVSPRTARLEDGEWLPVRGWPEFTERDAAAMAEQVPGVQAAAVRLGGHATVRYRGTQHGADVTLASASMQEFATRDLAGGRYFSRMESASNSPVVL
ncbi:MAG: ABC transporter permease, partial [Candidatus Eisenbacteria bacterium]|nr:ABC transporter permease [Candidatus Eisenbacteria bacterium]